MSARSIRYVVNVIKGGLFILPVVYLLVSDRLFFPFITTKGFFFRVIVEILFFLWVFVLVFDKKYRPKLTPVLVAVSATFFFLVLSTFFGEQPYRSFWSNYERMEGLIGHIHLFAYFLIVSTIFRTKKDWKWFFAAMVTSSLAVAFYGLLQTSGVLATHQGSRLDASLGNATYLAILMIFHMALIALFFHWFKNIWARIGLGALFVFELFIMFYTATRGSILGFIGGVFLFAFLMAVFSKNKKLRVGFASTVVLVVLLVVLFVLFKDVSFIKNHEVLGRFSSISLTETTTESRFTIWGMSWNAFQEHPILGWGLENYNLVFNKYFEPKLWRQEPWFDRSHNVLFDWLITTGLLGFLAYISIFVTAIYMLWRGYKKNYFSMIEVGLLVSLFGAYFAHNIFVFDNLTSYFAFFSVLGFIGSSVVWGEKQSFSSEKRDNDEIGFGGYIAVTFAFLVVVFSVYFVNAKPFFASRTLLEALVIQRQGATPDQVLERFDKALSYNGFGDREVAEQLSGYASGIVGNPNVSEIDKQKVMDRAIEEMKKQVDMDPENARYQIFLGNLYTRIGLYNEALAVMTKAHELSPNKQQIYFSIADIYFATNEFDKAVVVLKEAYELDKTYTETAKNLALAYIAGGEKEKGEQILMETYGSVIVANKQLLNAYAQIGDYEKVRDIWKLFIEKEPGSAQNHVSLAATYLQLNEKEKAIEELRTAAELNPEFEDSAMYYISEIMAGRNP